MSERPQIRKAIFILDKTRRYGFDVNQNITIHNLKRMIVSAANLNRATLRIFHDGIEYTQREYESLDALFPNEKVVEFTLGVDFNSEEELDSLLQIRLNRCYCTLHDAKYPYFYCYGCNKSICSSCLLSGDHSGHDIKEKYDCLQSSRLLIEKIFQDIKINLEKINDDKINDIKRMISLQFTSELVQMVKKIENEFQYLVTAFVAKEKDNIDKVKTNLVKLKSHCTEGLDTFKNEHEIEDLIIDEQLFLEFDAKFNDIASEKELMKKDINKCAAYSKILDIIISEVNKSYEEIKLFLQRYLKSEIYDNIRRRIEETIVNDVKKEDIIERHFSTNKKPKQVLRRIEHAPQQFATIYEEDEHMEVDNNNNNNHKYAPEATPSLPVKPTKHKKTSEFNVNDIELLICQPKENTPEVIIYSRTVDKRESIINKTIQNSLFSIPAFPNNCAWYNYNNKLYISGGYLKGFLSNGPSEKFYEYNPLQNTLSRLPDMPEQKQGHSMCVDNSNNLYVIGGNTNSILKYSFTTNTWTKLGIKLSTQRNHPSCVIRDNSVLYVFYGVNDSKKYVQSIEKGNLNSTSECTVVNKDKINLVYSGIIPSEGNSVFLIGGINEKEKQIKTAKKFNFQNNTIESSTFLLDEAACFHQNVLPDLGEGVYGYFILEGDMHFMKVRFD